MICEDCIYYPPSSLDGKPCSYCDTDSEWLNCFVQKEGDE